MDLRARRRRSSAQEGETRNVAGGARTIGEYGRRGVRWGWARGIERTTRRVMLVLAIVVVRRNDVDDVDGGRCRRGPLNRC